MLTIFVTVDGACVEHVEIIELLDTKLVLELFVLLLVEKV